MTAHEVIANFVDEHAPFIVGSDFAEKVVTALSNAGYTIVEQNAYAPTEADEQEAQGYAVTTRLSVESLRDGALAASRHNKREAWIADRAADIKEQT